MNQESVASPARLKKSQLPSTSSLHKSKVHLPSRYAQPYKQQKSGFHDILNSIESQIRVDQAKQKHQSPDPKPKQVYNQALISEIKIDQNSQFKAKPMKRQDNDMAQYHEIFINSREQSLKQLKKLQHSQEQPKNILREYQKVLKFQRGAQNDTQESEKIQVNLKQSYQQAIQLLESDEVFFSSMNRGQQDDFYEAQIAVEAPRSNSTVSVISVPKPIVSASLPQNYKSYKDLNLKQLLLRAKAGMNSDDIEKEAHLSFYLGEVYTQKKYYKQALKFFRRFLGLAKMMEDKIGMIVGANRVGLSYFNCKQYEKSISFHNQNLKLSDKDNLFFGLYNIGICYRRLQNPQQALQYFESALNWAQESGEDESECIAMGQIAVTYQRMEQFQEAVQKFEQSYLICEKIKKKNLKLNNLWNILRISSMLKTKTNEQLIKIAKEAFECAKEQGQVASLDVLRCNIGVLTGIDCFETQYRPLLDSHQEEIQQIDN